MTLISKAMQPLMAGDSVIRAMFEEGNRLAAVYGRENVYDFSLGNPNVPAPEAVNRAIRAVLEEEDPVSVHGYMSNAGYADVRAAVAASLNRRFSAACSADNLIMTAGAAAAMNIFLKVILNPGDEVITFAPFFSEYRNYVGNYGGRLVVIPADTETFQPDLEGFSAAITERTKAVIINTPNNPSGVIYSEEALRKMQSILREREAAFETVISVISDEPYRELVYDGCTVPWVPALIPHTAVVYSYSKSLSLPGERIGWLLLPDTLPEFRELLAAATMANRISGFVNAPSLIQRALLRCVDETADTERYNRNRELLYGKLTALGFSCVRPQGAFYLLVKAPDGDDGHFAAICKEQRILVVPCSSFACPGYVRIAYCVSEGMILRAQPAFRRVAEECGLREEENRQGRQREETEKR